MIKQVLNYQKFITHFIIPVLALISCNNGPDNENINDAQVSTYCYIYTRERDSISMNFTQTGEEIKGILHFDNYQIDGSRGTITGDFQNDTLWVEYHFMAEGMRNIVEEGFLKKGNSLIRGTGTRVQAGDKFVYQDRNSIDFTDGQTLMMIKCP